MSISRLIGLGLLLILPSLAFAQQTAFGSGQVDPDQPV